VSRIRRPLAAAALSLGLLLLAGFAAAHPAGFTSVNRYLGIGWIAPGRIHVAYLVDFAELPAYAEIDALDADHDGTATPDEQRAYLERRLPPLVAAWTVLVDGVRLAPIVTGSSLQISPGERGLETLRIAADVEAQLPGGDAEPATGAALQVIARDASFAERPGWREMAAEESPSAAVVSGAAGQARDALAYAQGSGPPPRVDEGRFAFRWRGAAAGSTPVPGRPGAAVAVDARVAEWSKALERSSRSLPLSLVALALALALGAGHALSPGHGKALAAAYLVGERARARHALLFGAAVTAAHTLVVFAIGCAALALERSFGSDRLLRGLEVVSAGAVTLLGVVQVSRRFREATAERAHDHGPGGEPGVGWRSLVALGASAGLTPCPSALALLLAAIALRRYAFGLVLVAAFSVGVAATLTIVGWIALAARRRVRDRADASPWAAGLLRWLPVVSSASVLLVGVLLCASAWSRP
jgi:ABC-type nickel/cobalt efflux system permease component RcnA